MSGGGPIFIGGTGRSGTTIVKTLLRSHPAVFGVGREAKFLVEPDGLIDLVDGLSTRWSPWTSESVLTRFEGLMRRLSWQGRWPERRVRGLAWRLGVMHSRRFSLARYSREDFGDRVGTAHYLATVRAFLADLEDFRFPGAWLGSTPFRWGPEVRQGKRFERPEIVARSAAFVDSLFEPGIDGAGAERWCDDTPENAMQAAFLHELYPDLRLIHVYRDPRDVIASGRRLEWAPPDAARGARRVATMHARWEEQSARLPERAAFDLRFETLVAEPEATLAALWRFLDLPAPPDPPPVDLSRHNVGRYRTELTTDEIAHVEATLGPWMAEHGYDAG